MSASAKDEIADNIQTTSVREQFFEHARKFPDVKHLCPWCGVPVLGAELAVHCGWHEREDALREDVPSHWMAL